MKRQLSCLVISLLYIGKMNYSAAGGSCRLGIQSTKSAGSEGSIFTPTYHQQVQCSTTAVLSDFRSRILSLDC